MSRLVFIDTETTSLRPDRRAWEVALIVREDNRDVEYHWYIDARDLDLGNADLQSLRYGRFYDRHPHPGVTVPRRDPADLGKLWPEAKVMAKIEELTRGAHLVGVVPSFDAELLGTRMRAHGLCPAWSHHLIDVNALMLGWLAARRDPKATGPAFPLPWRSDDLAARVGVVAEPGSRHTALGDARWACDIYDTITGRRAALPAVKEHQNA